MKTIRKIGLALLPVLVAGGILMSIPQTRALADSYVGTFMRDTSGNLDVTLRTGTNTAQMASNNSDATGALTSLGTVGFNFGYNGTSWDRLRSTNTGQLITEIAGNNSSGGFVTNAFPYSNSDANASSTVELAVGAFGLGYNGTSWDRLRTAQAVSAGYQVGSLAVAICADNTRCADTGAFANSDAGSVASQLAAASYGMGFNGTTWDRLHSRSGERQITDGGNSRVKATATTCTSISTTAGTLHRVIAAGAETATLTIYDEGATPSCLTADIVYNKVPPNGTADSLDLPINNGMAYKLSAAAATNVYFTSNQ